MVGLNGSSLLARCRRTGVGAGVCKYLVKVGPDVEMAGNLAQRPVFAPVQAMNGVDLVRSQHMPEPGYKGKELGLP